MFLLGFTQHWSDSVYLSILQAEVNVEQFGEVICYCSCVLERPQEELESMARERQLKMDESMV